MPKTQYFTPALFDFLRDLAENNEREWFQAHKARYEKDVRDPMLRFVGAFAPHLEKISPHFVADPRPVGGSLFRIYRDTRFSKDKTPYKANVGAQFRHERGKDAHAPGFYLHLEPGEVFCGAGIWHPDAETTGKIRESIVNKTAEWDAAVFGKGFAGRFSLAGDALKKPPRGYEAEHPRIEHLKRKDFLGLARFTEQEVCAPGFMALFVATCRTGSPLAAFLTRALGLPF